MTPLPSDIYKSMILSNPFQCKWRLDCLFSMFFDPKSTFSFSEDGHIVPSFDVSAKQWMNHDAKPYAKSLKGSSLSKKEIAIRKDYEKNLYVFIEANIDAIAKSPVHFNERHDNYYTNYPADVITKDSLFFNLPENVAAVWIEEIKFVGQEATNVLWKAFCGEYGVAGDDSIWSNKEAYVLNQRIWTIIETFKKAH